MKVTDGFSLLELLIALCITAILIAIAIPTYDYHIAKGKRIDGKIALLDLAARMERYYTEHHTYASATLGSQLPTDVLNTDFSPQGFYRLRIVNQTNITFLVQATPVLEKFNDKNCGAFQLNQWGEKLITGRGTVTECWGR